MTIAAGIDVGTGAVKAALFKVEGDNAEWLSRSVMRIRQRDPMQLARIAFDQVLADAKLGESDVDYVATTGEAEGVPVHTGHFDSMTTHARGAIYLEPTARSVLDVGALHGRAISIDDRGKVLSYKMTSQCASGSGQFLENIARYHGIGQDEIGTLSKKADNPEVVSSICAVLAATDVINMVSRGISAPNILKGIHLSMAGRLSKLLKSIGADRRRRHGDRRPCARRRPGRRAGAGHRRHEEHVPAPCAAIPTRSMRERSALPSGGPTVTTSSPRKETCRGRRRTFPYGAARANGIILNKNSRGLRVARRQRWRRAMEERENQNGLIDQSGLHRLRCL